MILSLKKLEVMLNSEREQMFNGKVLIYILLAESKLRKFFKIAFVFLILKEKNRQGENHLLTEQRRYHCLSYFGLFYWGVLNTIFDIVPYFENFSSPPISKSYTQLP